MFLITIFTATILCGCDNPFSKSEEQVATTATTTTIESTVEENTELVTLKRTTTAPQKKDNIQYYSENMGALFTLPSSWENKFAIEDDTDKYGNKYVSFYEKDIYRIDNKGLIFTYNLFLNKNYTRYKNYTEYGTATAEDGTVYYIVSTLPTSSQYDEKNKNLKKAYENMSKDNYIASICNRVYFDNTITIDKEGCSTTLPTTEASSTTDNIEGSSTKVGETTVNNSSSGLVFPDIQTRMLTDSEVKALSSDEIQQAINDICALHGYSFTTPEIVEHYQQFSWYKPSESFSEAEFSTVEKYNYELLQKYR